MMIVLSLVALLMLAKERDELRYRLASERDPLTNLANRRTFVTEAKAALGQEGGTSLLLLDIDHFKIVNDTHGHAAGDQVLIAFSRAIEQRMPKGWLFARLGGEEFACLLPRVGVQKALALAEELRLAVADMAISPLSPLQVTVSIGVAEANASGADLDMLLASADAALYRAKADGRNCVRLCEPAVLLDDTAATLALAVGKPGRSAPRIRRRGK
jgi:diguanylate cyclase (GGDEF)-like protein